MMSDLELIKQIEQRIGMSLQRHNFQLLIDWGVKGYALDIHQQVIALNLEKTDLEDISFLTQFTNLEKLNLDNNNITDISVLKKLKNLTALLMALKFLLILKN